MKSGERDEKKAYAPPRLVLHGTVEQITQDVGNVNSDGVLGTRVAP